MFFLNAPEKFNKLSSWFNNPTLLNSPTTRTEIFFLCCALMFKYLLSVTKVSLLMCGTIFFLPTNMMMRWTKFNQIQIITWSSAFLNPFTDRCKIMALIEKPVVSINVLINTSVYDFKSKTSNLAQFTLLKTFHLAQNDL